MTIVSHHISAMRHLKNRLPLRPGENFGVFVKAAEQLEALAVALHEAGIDPDNMLSEKALGMRREAAAKVLMDAIAKLRSETDDAARSERRQMAATRNQKAALVPGEHAAEMRTIFRGLPADEKLKFLAEIVKNGDGQTMAALLAIRYPSYALGIGENALLAHRDMLIDKLAPGNSDDIDAAESNIKGILNSAASFASEALPPEPSRPAPIAARA